MRMQFSTCFWFVRTYLLTAIAYISAVSFFVTFATYLMHPSVVPGHPLILNNLLDNPHTVPPLVLEARSKDSISFILFVKM